MKNTFIPVIIFFLVFFQIACTSTRPEKKTPPVSALIRLNSIGFLPDYKKVASIAGECSVFEVKNTGNNKTVYSGKVTGPVKNEDTGEQIYCADFSSLSQPGIYYLSVPGIGESARFTIDTGIYTDVFKTLMLGMYLWRCSTPVSALYKGIIFSHKEAHMNDGYLDFITDVKNDFKDGTGGWYDAGDYGKYIVNAGITTGETTYLDDVETRILSMGKTVITDFDWPDVRNLGVFTYLLSQRKGKKAEITSRLEKELIKAADSLVQTARTNTYRRPLGKTYYWGCNGTVARQTIILYMAYLFSKDREYITTMLDAIGHLLGRNYYCRSYVTGLGYNPPMYPHDRRSGGDDIQDPWPGYLVGGGHAATDWVDKQEDYSRNEIAINWNSALIFAVAAFVE